MYCGNPLLTEFAVIPVDHFPQIDENIDRSVSAMNRVINSVFWKLKKQQQNNSNTYSTVIDQVL
jgi:hypothetical protein